MAKIIITGGTGFIGKNLNKELIKRGHKVEIISRGNIEYKFDLLKKKFMGFDTLIHLAGKRLNRNSDMNLFSPSQIMQ